MNKTQPASTACADRGRLWFAEVGWGGRPPQRSIAYLFCGGLPLLPLPVLPELPVPVPLLVPLPVAPLVVPLLVPLLMLPLDGAGAVELAGGVEAGVLVVDGCLAQAANSIAAASALRATFIFIDDTPVE